ncbi:MAG: DNA mismatch repair endonuclease MutL [Armatimonadetes bacterium]|nr:DNA mismatch repair endonuclease MutL [Armatimonadota bacterium]
MAKVVLLAQWLADRIAAGEIVERPASVVKELVENALDAGATQVVVDIESGGFTAIRVADDGEGMSSEDARLAIQRFATSKIRHESDLSAIRTLGFRGEALPSIGAVSHLEIQTSDGAEGTRLRVEGGGEAWVEAAAGPRGTVVTVRHLYFNTPARRRFLRSIARESALCTDAVERLALSRPDVAFRLRRDDEEILWLPPAAARERAATVLGATPKQLLPIDDREGPLSVTGFVGLPEIARRSRQGQHFAVNGRPVQSALLGRAVEQGAHTLLFTGTFPVCAVAVTAPPDRVDPNVHPRKLEVRFADDRAIFALVERATRAALHAAPLVRHVQTTTAPPAGAASYADFGHADQPALIAREPSPLEAAAIFGEAAAADVPTDRDHRRLPPLRLLGQVGRTYLVASCPEGLALIDQHAAHERVLYERLLRDRGRQDTAQTLAVPIPIEVSTSEAELADDMRATFAGAGFEVERFGADTLLLRAVPTVTARVSPERILREGIAELEQTTLLRSPKSAIERLTILTACRSAVKAGDVLSRAEMEALIADLEACEDPYTCFHGRPTLVVVPARALEAYFLRR